jgi:5-methylcytosine-specific restriction enzyme subunit McrC
VERLTHGGLVKRYRLTQGNLHKLKGRILFPQHIRRNALHQECIFTAHETYDRDNPFNRILKSALTIVERLAIRQSLVSRAAASLLWFEQVTDARIAAQTFERLTFGRNTERYRRAIQLARLIILNYSPDLRGGREHVFAILFDMNKLFERFIFVQLRRTQTLYASRRLSITGQASRLFWSSKAIRPDIVADFASDGAQARVILDTKWKVPRDGQPADDDLKQMYAYNLHFGSHRSVLVYPSAGSHQVPTDQPYVHSLALPPGHRHNCATLHINLFDAENRLRNDIGQDLVKNAILAAG